LSEVGERVRTLRRERGWSQSELGSRANLGYQAVSDIERGIKTPRLESRKALADALGVDLDELLVDLAAGKAVGE
jgi:transcriptional regulator with XRE-family HTH domain